MLRRKKKKINLVCATKNKIQRRQDAPKCYDLTTVCYAFKPNYIVKNDNLFKGRVGIFKIPKNRAIDIDHIDDYKLVKALSNKSEKNCSNNWIWLNREETCQNIKKI